MYRTKIFISTIPIEGYDFKVKVTDLEFYDKVLWAIIMMIVKCLMPGLAPSLLRYLTLKFTVLGFLKHLTK